MAYWGPGQTSVEPVQTEEESTGAEASLQPPRTVNIGDVTIAPVAMETHHPDTSSQQDPSSTPDEEQTELNVSQPCRTQRDSVYDVIESVIQQARARSACSSGSAADPLTPSVQLTMESEKPSGASDGVCSKEMGAGDEEATDGVYVCPICSRECSAPKYLKLHLLKHENDRQRPLDCDMCGKTFSTHQSMKLHRYTHTGEKPFACKICHKHFRQAGTLKRHMVTHTGEQPHRCPHCPRHFSQRSSLTAHIRLHTDQNAFLCVQCGKSFKTERYMKRHMIYHTDRLPFSCELCDKRFRTRLNMRRHMLRIHLLATRKVCRCLTCGAEMQNPGALKNHMAVHNTGRKPYRAFVCEVCGRRFQQRSKLKKHKQEKHGGGDGELNNQPGVQPHVRADQVCRVMTRTIGQQRVTTYEMIPKDLDQFAHIVFPANGRPSKDLNAESLRKSATDVPSTVPQVIMRESSTCNTEQNIAVGQETVPSATVSCGQPFRTSDIRTDPAASMAAPSSVSVGYSASPVGAYYTNATISSSLSPVGVSSATPGCSAVADTFSAAGTLAAVNPFVPSGFTAAMSAPIARGTLSTTSVTSTPAFAATTTSSLPSDTLGSSSQSVLSAVSTRESVSETLAALRALAAQEGDIFHPADFGVGNSGGQYAVEGQSSHQVGNVGTSSGTDCGTQCAAERHTQQSLETSVTSVTPAMGIVDTIQQTEGTVSGPDTPGTRIRVESQNQALLSRVLLAGKVRGKRSPGSLWEGGQISCKTCSQGFPTVSKFQEHLKKFGKITYWETTEGGDKVMGLRCVSGKKVTRKTRKKGGTKKKEVKGRKTANSLGVQELLPSTSSALVADTSVPSSQDAQTLSHEHSYQKPYGQESVIESTSSTSITIITNSVVPSNVSAAGPSLEGESMPSNSSQEDTSVNNCNQNFTGATNDVDSMLNDERATEARLAVLSNVNTNDTSADSAAQGGGPTSHELESESCPAENGDSESGAKKGVKKKTQAVKGAVCPTCGMKFAYKSSLRTHQFIHSGEKPYPCTVCKKSFRQAGDLQRHLVVHTGERRYTCQICKKGYKQSGDLAAHMMDHTDDVRFSCPVCSKRLKRKCDLRKHMYTHTGFYPFQCDLCGKQFREKAKMLNHKRNKHGAQKIFVCEVCGKQFNHPGCLKNHLRKHTGNKPHVCGVCSKGYVQRGKLLKHMRTHQQTNTQVPQWGIVEEVVLQETGGVNLMDQAYEENVMNVFRTIEAAQALTFMPEAVVEIQL